MPPPTSAPLEPAIIAALQSGDQAALGIIMGRYLQDVFALAYHYTRDADTANDIAQDVFIRFWERRTTLKDDMPVIHWLRRSARNAALDVLRHRAVVSRWEESQQQAYPNAPGTLQQSGMTDADVDTFMATLRHAIASLPPRQQEIALLYHERGLEPGEIATLLEVAPQTVYNQLQSVMKTLAEAFGDLDQV